MSVAYPLLRAGAALLAPGGERSKLAVLMYHRVLPAFDALTGEVDARSFEAQMSALKACFNVLPLREAIERLKSGTLPARAASITFDDGYADNAEIALPILQRHRLHASFFIADGFLDGGRMFNDTVIESIRRMPGPRLDVPAAGLAGVAVGSVAEKQAALVRVLKAVKYLAPDERLRAVEQIGQAAGGPLPDDLMMSTGQVRSLTRSGMDVGGHTVHHPILTRLPLDQARDEIESNRRALEAMTGQRPDLFAYPNGVPGDDYDATHVALVRAAGYRAAVSTSWGAAVRGCDVHQIPRFTPWDREPRRFVARLLHNLVRRRPVFVDDVAQVVAG